jgi:hypothetical protein
LNYRQKKIRKILALFDFLSPEVWIIIIAKNYHKKKHGRY